MCEMPDTNRCEKRNDVFKPPMNCPKCGFLQIEGPQCLRCGLVFARYHVSEAPRHKPEHFNAPSKPARAYFASFYMIFGWASLAGLIAVIVLIIHASEPPQVVVTPDASQHAEAKIQAFQSPASREMEKELILDESELNGWINENLMLKRSQNSPAVPSYRNSKSPASSGKKAAGSNAFDNMSSVQIQSSVRDVKIKLLEDSLRIYAIFDAHGMDLSLELEGQLLVRDGYMRLAPTGGKLGSLPLMAGMLQRVADRIFDAPENKEKFRLPPDIRDIRIDHACLIVTPR
jgi:hypothetical protein